MNPFEVSSDGAKYEFSPPEPDEGVMIVSRTGRVVHASPRIAEILGGTQQELYGNEVMPLIPPALRPKIRSILKSERVVEPWSHEVTKRDGSRILVITRSIPAEVAGRHVRMVFMKRAKVQPKTQEREAQ